MTDLSKIDFSKCKLPRGMTVGHTERTCHTPEAVFIRDCKLECVCFKETGDGWRVRFSAQPLLDDMLGMQSTCAQVDTFIAAELKRIGFQPADVSVSIGDQKFEAMDLEPGDAKFFGECPHKRVIIASRSWFNVLERAVREYKAAHS